MNDRQDINEHADQWNDDLAAYVLDALDPAELEVVSEHIAGCDTCSERVRWMTPAVDVLPATVTPRQPPPALKSRVMDVVQRESSMIESAADPDRAARSERAAGSARRLLPRFSGFSLRPVVAGLGVFLLLAAGVAGYTIHDNNSTSASGQVYTAQAPKSGSLASGSLEVDGDSGSLHVASLPATSKDEVYQAWIQDPRGSIEPSSVFVVGHGGVGDVAIPHGLEGARRVMVTREPKGGSKLPTENPVLIAEMN